MKLTLRLITVISYFLPFTFFFTTCNNGLNLRISYNQAEANKNIELDKESAVVSETIQVDEQALVDITKSDTISQSILSDTIKTASDTLRKKNNYIDLIIIKMIRPTKKSLSGIGSILYFKNEIGKVAIAISLMISFILLVAFKFIKSRRIILSLLLITLICLAIFIIDSFISSVTLVWGSWTLLILLLLQIIQEFNNKPKKFS